MLYSFKTLSNVGLYEAQWTQFSFPMYKAKVSLLAIFSLNSSRLISFIWLSVEEHPVNNNVTKDMDVAKDMEIFGPVISVIGFDDVDEAIEIANQSSYGLCGCVISKDYSRAMKIADKLECGGAVVNGASFYRSFEMPFGGWKHSGIGNEGVLTTLQEMSRIKTIVLKNIL